MGEFEEIEREMRNEDVEYYRPRKEIEIKKGRPPTSERAYWVQMTIDMLGNHYITKRPYSFKQINGVTKDWPVEWIKEMYAVCSKNKIPSKLWWGLIKKSKSEKNIRTTNGSPV